MTLNFECLRNAFFARFKIAIRIATNTGWNNRTMREIITGAKTSNVKIAKINPFIDSIPQVVNKNMAEITKTTQMRSVVFEVMTGFL